MRGRHDALKRKTTPCATSRSCARLRQILSGFGLPGARRALGRPTIEQREGPHERAVATVLDSSAQTPGGFCAPSAYARSEDALNMRLDEKAWTEASLQRRVFNKSTSKKQKRLSQHTHTHTESEGGDEAAATRELHESGAYLGKPHRSRVARTAKALPETWPAHRPRIPPFDIACAHALGARPWVRLQLRAPLDLYPEPILYYGVVPAAPTPPTELWVIPLVVVMGLARPHLGGKIHIILAASPRSFRFAPNTRYHSGSSWSGAQATESGDVALDIETHRRGLSGSEDGFIDLLRLRQGLPRVHGG